MSVSRSVRTPLCKQSDRTRVNRRGYSAESQLLSFLSASAFSGFSLISTSMPPFCSHVSSPYYVCYPFQALYISWLPFCFLPAEDWCSSLTTWCCLTAHQHRNKFALAMLALRPKGGEVWRHYWMFPLGADLLWANQAVPLGFVVVFGICTAWAAIVFLFIGSQWLSMLPPCGWVRYCQYTPPLTLLSLNLRFTSY